MRSVQLEAVYRPVARAILNSDLCRPLQPRRANTRILAADLARRCRAALACERGTGDRVRLHAVPSQLLGDGFAQRAARDCRSGSGPGRTTGRSDDAAAVIAPDTRRVCVQLSLGIPDTVIDRVAMDDTAVAPEFLTQRAGVAQHGLVTPDSAKAADRVPA